MSNNDLYAKNLWVHGLLGKWAFNKSRDHYLASEATSDLNVEVEVILYFDFCARGSMLKKEHCNQFKTCLDTDRHGVHDI